MAVFEPYSFNFLATISEQLVRRLDRLPASKLDAANIHELSGFQKELERKQGVYVIQLDGNPVYLGKANDVAERLSQHLKKLSGRLNLNMNGLAFKALLLDESMSTAANEELLIGEYSRRHQGMWNGQGFGSKDPGRNRDRTEPGAFDKAYPIRRDHPVECEDELSIEALLSTLKAQLPYLFRYGDLPQGVAQIILDLKHVPRTAESVVKAAVQYLPPNWHAAILSYGIVVYEGLDSYWHTAEVVASPGSEALPPAILTNRKKGKAKAQA